MPNLSLLEEYYRKYIKSLSHWIPEGIFTIDLALLHRFDLLHARRPEYRDPSLSRYFQVIESPEKITLVNDDFVVWIMSDKIDLVPVTFTLIAVNTPHYSYPKLEVAFVASGVYNSSRLILKVLEKFLMDIQETEELLKQITSH